MNGDPTVWLIIGGLCLTTFLVRWSCLGFFAARSLPGWLETALGFVPVTVIPALVAPMILVGSEPLAHPERWLAGLATLVLGMTSRSLIGGFAGGMITYYLVRLLN